MGNTCVKIEVRGFGKPWGKKNSKIGETSENIGVSFFYVVALLSFLIRERRHAELTGLLPLIERGSGNPPKNATQLNF